MRIGLTLEILSWATVNVNMGVLRTGIAYLAAILSVYFEIFQINTIKYKEGVFRQIITYLSGKYQAKSDDLYSIATLMKSLKRGWGLRGVDLNSGWN